MSADGSSMPVSTTAAAVPAAARPGAVQALHDDRSRVGAGMAFMVGGMVFAPMMDVVAKVLTATLPTIEITFGRFVAQMVVVLVAATVLGRWRDLIPPRLGLHMLRGFSLACCSLLFFTGLKVLPITDALAIAFVEPVILTALSAMFLGEKVGWRRWTACVVGFVGSLVIVRPSFQVFGPAALLPLGSACLFALYHVLTRILSGDGSVLAAQFATGLAGTVLIAPVLAATSALGVADQVAVVPEGWQIGLLLSIGVLSFVSHGLIINAFERAPAAVLAPFGYLEIVVGSLAGYLLFHEVPSWTTWVGIALIVGSGLYIVHRERLRAAAA